MTVDHILSLTSADARDWARHTDDRDLLVEVQVAAAADESRPRRTLLAAIEYRLSTLRSHDDDEVVARNDLVAAEVEPVVVPTVEPVASVDHATCAAAFVAALRSGDAVLVAAMIADVRRDGGDDDAMASALVAAMAASVPAPARVRVATGTPKSTGVDVKGRISKVIEIIGGEGPEYHATPEQMVEAGFPASWIKHAAAWSMSNTAGRAAHALGFKAKHSTLGVTLTRN